MVGIRNRAPYDLGGKAADSVPFRLVKYNEDGEVDNASHALQVVRLIRLRFRRALRRPLPLGLVANRRYNLRRVRARSACGCSATFRLGRECMPVDRRNFLKHAGGWLGSAAGISGMPMSPASRIAPPSLPNADEAPAPNGEEWTDLSEALRCA